MTMAGLWRIEVDRDRCRGSGTCEGLAARHFALDLTTHKVSVHQDLVPADDSIIDAAMSCPLEAIGVVDSESGKVLYPEDS